MPPILLGYPYPVDAFTGLASPNVVPSSSPPVTVCLAGTYAVGAETSSVAADPANQVYAGSAYYPSVRCQDCDLGAIALGNGNTICTACPADKYASGDNTTCLSCPGNSTAPAGTAIIDTCTCKIGYQQINGTMRNNTYLNRMFQSFTCSQCAPGTSYLYSDGILGGSCPPCTVGTFSSTYSASVCGPCPSGYANNSDMSACTACPAGTQIALDGGSCLPCAAGSSSAGAASGAFQCTGCAPGTVSGASAATCTACPAGSYASPDSTTCIACSPGQFASAGATQCTACPSGQWSPANSSTCTQCSAGTFLATASAQSCTTCPRGSYSSSSATYCPACSIGSWSNGTSCFACAAGTSLNAVSQSCDVCASGFFSTPSSVSCSPCAAGSASLAGSAQCTPCPAGSFLNGTVCTLCAQGYFSYLGSSLCTACPAGAFAPANSSACTTCAAGSFLATASAQSCTTCPRGSYSGASATYCPACSIGSWSNGTACFACVEGTALNAVTQSCDICPRGTYSSSAAISCSHCAAGSASLPNSASCTPCKEGEFLNATALVCQPCPVGSYSPGAGASSCLSNPAGSVSTAASVFSSSISLAGLTAASFGDSQKTSIASSIATTLGVAASAVDVTGVTDAARRRLLSAAVAFSVTTPSTVNASTLRSALNATTTFSSALEVTLQHSNDTVLAAVTGVVAVTPSEEVVMLAAEPCPIGTYLNALTQSCVDCAPGQVTTSTGSATCSLCPARTAWVNGSYCQTCPNNAITSPFDVAQCACSLGFYDSQYGDDPASPVCVTCPLLGATCVTGFVAAKAGFWRENTRSDIFYKCLVDNCEAEVVYGPLVALMITPDMQQSGTFTRRRLLEGGESIGSKVANYTNASFLLTNTSEPTNCVEGNTGPLCALCLPGYSVQSGQCLPCSPSDAFTAWNPGLQAILYILCIFAGIIVVVFGLFRPLSPYLEDVSAAGANRLSSVADSIYQTLFGKRKTAAAEGEEKTDRPDSPARSASLLQLSSKAPASPAVPEHDAAPEHSTSVDVEALAATDMHEPMMDAPESLPEEEEHAKTHHSDAPASEHLHAADVPHIDLPHASSPPHVPAHHYTISHGAHRKQPTALQAAREDALQQAANSNLAATVGIAIAEEAILENMSAGASDMAAEALLDGMDELKEMLEQLQKARAAGGVIDGESSLIPLPPSTDDENPGELLSDRLHFP